MADVVNTLYLNFTTQDGNDKTLSIKYAAEAIAEASDDIITLIQTAAKWFLNNQPFDVTLASFDSAEFNEDSTTIITDDVITAEDAAESSTESEE